MSLWANRLTCVANLWMYPSHWWIALIHENNGFNRATTMSVNIRFCSPLWFAIQIELQHIAELLTYRREPGDLQNRCFEFPQIPVVFTFPLKWDTYTMRLQVSRYCWWSPAEQKPGSNAGFWVPCVCFKGITVWLWNKEVGMNLIFPQRHTNSHVFHTFSLSPPSSVFDFTVSAIMCWCPFSIKCDLQLGGDILGWVISRVLYSVLPYSNINAPFFA